MNVVRSAFRREIAALFLIFVLELAMTSAQALQLSGSTTKTSLTIFLQHYLNETYGALEEHGPTNYSSAFVDLNDDGTREVIVYVTGRGWCGTGGCLMLILEPDGPAYTVIARTGISWPPIRVLTTKSNGWHDLTVAAAGGGMQPGYEAELSFNGETYPSNPSVPPARPFNGRTKGKIAISEKSKSEVLYP